MKMGWVALLALGCSSSVEIRRSTPAEGAEDVTPGAPVELELARGVDTSGARVVWQVRGVDLSDEIPSPRNLFPGNAIWGINLHVPAKVEADGRKLLVTPLFRPPAGLVQEVRVEGLRAGDRDESVTLSFRTRPNPRVAVIRPLDGAHDWCTVDGANRVETCRYGTGTASPDGAFTDADFDEIYDEHVFAWDGPRLLERRRVESTGDLTALTTFTYGPDAIPVQTLRRISRFDPSGPPDIGTDAIVLEVDEAGFVSHRTWLDAGDDGEPFTDDDGRVNEILAYEVDARGRLFRTASLDVGPDELPRTDDDVVLSYVERTYDRFSRPTFVSQVDLGTDGLPFTADDRALRTTPFEYGAPVFWLDALPETSDQLVYTYDDDGQLLTLEETFEGELYRRFEYAP